jgi:hypothetical protein
VRGLRFSFIRTGATGLLSQLLALRLSPLQELRLLPQGDKSPPLSFTSVYLGVGSRGPQETVYHIARITVGSGDCAGRVDAPRK